MKKSTKGALAASAAGVLMLGGAGTLAYWTDATDVPGTGIASGNLALSDPTCTDGWRLDGDIAFTSQKIVPGDTLSQTCTVTVTASGAHLRADFDTVVPSFESANDLTAELTPTAVYMVDGDVVSGTDVPVQDGDVITVEIEVDFPGSGATNDSRSLTATLDAITITATQSHAAPVV